MESRKFGYKQIKNIILTVVAVIVLCFLINLFLCNKPRPTHVEDKKEVDSLKSVINQNDIIYKKNMQSLKDSRDQLDVEVQVLKSKAAVKDLELSRTRKQVAAALAQVKISRAQKDTSQILADVDDLIPVVEKQDQEIDSLIDRNAQLEDLRIQQLAKADSAAAASVQAYNEIKKAFETTTTKFDGVYSDLQKEQKKNRNVKTVLKGSLVANLILLAGIYFITK